MTKEIFDQKWGNIDTDELPYEEKLKFKEDCFQLYEQTGFAEKFKTPYTDENGHNGMSFEVISRAKLYDPESDTHSKDDVDLDQMPMWLVRFENGDTSLCFPEEICRIEQEELAEITSIQRKKMMPPDVPKEHIYYGNKIIEYPDGTFLATKLVGGDVQSKQYKTLHAAKAFIHKPAAKHEYTQSVQLSLKVQFNPLVHTSNTASMNIMSQEFFNKLLGSLADGSIEVTEVKFK